MAIPYVPAFPAGLSAQAPPFGVVYAAASAGRTPRSRVGRTRSQSFPAPTPLVSDADLLARLRGGDHAAFDAIFRQWYEPVVRSANRVLHDPGVAEELSQDIFLELWRRRESLAPDSSVAGYLLQAVRNRALNHLRHLQVQRKSAVYVEALSEPAEHADVEAQASEVRDAIRDAIAALPPRTREVFLLSRERNLRYVEIAEQLGVSVKAVEANMSRALRQLREKLSPFLPSAGE
jgi:RNA polymerase sigma-70 factor, ECF subfamily